MIIAAVFCLTLFNRVGKGGDSDFVFSGTIQALPGSAGLIGEWTVSGRKVRVGTFTQIMRDGAVQIVVGTNVKVEGFLQTNGSVTAKKIEVIQASKGSNISYSGKVEALPAKTGRLGDWKVGGVTVRVGPTTYIKQEKAPVATGDRIKVEGARRADGSVDAYKIEANSEVDDDDDGVFEFRGAIESLPNSPGRIGQWSVGGRKVNVTPATSIKPDNVTVAIGCIVKVRGLMRSDGQGGQGGQGNQGSLIDAREIVVESRGGGGGSMVEFQGAVETLPGTAGQIGAWTVSGRRVNVAATTKIELESGPVTVGSAVEIRGALLPDGSVNAMKIEVENAADPGRFFGKIEALPSALNLIGDWLVGGRTIRVTAPTRIERKYGLVVVGAFVEIRGAIQPDGSIAATRIEVKQGSAGGAYMNYNPATTVSAASYQEDNAPESIVTAFGSNMSSTTAFATSQPLPLSLGDVSVVVDGKQARLFFVAPNQINYQVPPDTPLGLANVVVMNKGQAVLQGTILVSSVALSLFTADASGLGPPAGLLLRVRADGQQVYESLARLDTSRNRIVPAPIARRPGEQLFLILFGSGLRCSVDTDRNSGNGVAENVQATIGGVNAQTLFAGIAPGFVGLEQCNIRIPDNAPANPSTQVVIRARDLSNNLKQANTLTISLQ
ncbi:MAG TPA: DUF5666 domain-containing protein [Blastocatellia bacterium]|nr:DUF5666 domain-containing protein [Blastocatellia bacterium]